jgi:hypothetical protein
MTWMLKRWALERFKWTPAIRRLIGEVGQAHSRHRCRHRFRFTRPLRPRPRPPDSRPCHCKPSVESKRSATRGSWLSCSRSQAMVSYTSSLTAVLGAKGYVEVCADCKTNHPRWASHNLGIFLWSVLPGLSSLSLGRNSRNSRCL